MLDLLVRWRGYPSRVCQGVPSQVQVGGTPARSSWGGVLHLSYPPSDLAGGTPAGGCPTSGTPCQTWQGQGYPCWGVPHLRYSPIRSGQGVPLLGGTPPQVPPIRPGQGGIPPRVTDGVLDTPRSVCLLRSCRTFLLIVTLLLVER